MVDTPGVVWLDAACEVFCTVSPEDYHWAISYRWMWRWDRTKRKKYAVRNTWRDGRRVTLYMHKEILDRAGEKQPSEAHTIGDHGNGQSLCNERWNLSWATLSMNRRNRRPGAPELVLPAGC